MNAGLGASSLDAGDDHTCVIGSYGMTYCWGANFYGQLGNGSWTQSTSPALVQTNASFVSVSAGGQSTCGATASYELYCWGAGFPDGIHYTAAFDRYPFWGYALANPTPVVQTVINEAAFVPVIMPIGSNYRVTVGTGFACAYYSTYTSSVSGASVDPSALVTYCWGWNDKGQTGYDPSINPFEAPALSSTGQYNLTRVSAGGHFTCADQPNGSVGCFGDDAALQLGIQLPYGTSSFRPISITGLHGVSAGDDHACALDASGYAYCWGNPQFGEIGVSANTNPKTKVSSTIMFRAIAAGGRHTCGIGTDNKIYCWGDNSDGQLGNGATSGSSMAPVIAAAP
jgi:alpha-tubulin suppressor-like RCC1 family protein